MGENLRLLYDLMDYTNHNDLPGLLLLIDFEKAFDSVSCEFMFKVLDLYNQLIVHATRRYRVVVAVFYQLSPSTG